MKKSHRILCVTAAIIFAVQAGQAQYAEDALRYSQLGLGVSARQLGMGNATVGGVDDYSALFWNPAGLALERNFEFSFGLSWLGYSNDISYLNTKTSSDKNVLNLNNLGFVYPIPTTRGSLTFAFGFNRAANYTTTASMNAFNPNSSIVQSPGLLDQPLDSNIPYWLGLAYQDTLGIFHPTVTRNVQQMINVLEGGGLNHWTVGGAIDIGRNLSFGVSLNFASGSYSYDRNFIESDSHNLYTTPPDDFSQFNYESTINDDLSGFNALFGLMFRKPGKYSLGVAIRTATTYDISETYTDRATSQFKTADTDNNFSYFYPNSSTASGSNAISYKVTTPYVLSAGINIHPIEWLVLAGDLEYTDWTQMEFNTNNTYLIAENSRIKNDLQATTNLRGGIEITLARLGMKLRGGIIDNPSPWKGDPSSRDQLYYTGGVGLNLDENMMLNVGYAYGTWKTLRTNYSYYDAANNFVNVGTDETVTTSNLNVSLLYRF